MDFSPFNPGKWAVKIKTISVGTSMFHLTTDSRIPEADHFDEGHIAVMEIHIDASNINIIGDTIHGNINNCKAQERCGLTVKTMRSKVSVSPVASICEDLYVETNYSKVQNYYAMHYTHFPCFNSYIDSVTMVGHLRDAVIDKRDLAFFAPQLKKFPDIIMHVSGDGKGTVANLSAQHMNATDGHVVVKGDITMKGLPDIYNTYITFNNGEIATTGAGVLYYAPVMKNNPNLALEHLAYVYFKGRYEGYIENFSVAGSFNTNLGLVNTDIKMTLPGFNSNTATYSGTVITDNFQIGTILRQPLFGGITLNEHVSGHSFNPELVQLNLDGKISEFTVKGYPYHNIYTHGILAKKQFDGSLLVDDPNLGLEFDGGINYSNKNLVINATAHILGSNFYALHLTADTITATADFDLNWTGSNIDNFSGFAKLNNIDLKRNSHKVAIDSVFINATGDSLNRSLTVQSNAVLATITGSYQLSKLPASVQYYLSKYIPNYIQAPEKFAPDQKFEFTVRTYKLDSIFAVTLPLFSGFDSSVIKGSFNTTAQKLLLIADIPNGSIGRVHMSNISITGLGNLDMLGLNASTGYISLGDSSINGSLSVTSTLSNDSVTFTIATSSPDTASALTLKGNILAKRDSLFLTILPSEFSLNQVKWDIAGGSKVVYSDKYLLVEGLKLSSGMQKITASTDLQNNDRTIIIGTENLDLGQLGSWAGLAMYQPDGRVNGTIKIDKVFDDLFISANIKATDVKLGNDTVGTVNLIGSYNGKKKLLNLDPQTGIYRGNASVVASGNISFDSTTHQKLDGRITFNDAPVVWATPFLAGIMSHLKGTVKGSIGFNGTSYEPELNGTVNLFNGGVRIDYLGCDYTIPFATIQINNKRIEFGKVLIMDRYSNMATLTGHFSHNLFNNMRMRLNIQSNKFEVMNLTSADNNIFYGNLIAKMDSFTMRGPFNNLRLNIYGASPAAKSSIFLPVSSGSDGSTVTYASFKDYGTSQNNPTLKKNKRSKIGINIYANMNTLAEMHIVLDPSTGDEIMARGDGGLLLEIPPDNDVRISGTYTIDNGMYKFTFPQFFISRQFKLNSGSTISFRGPFSDTYMDIDAIYTTKARLFDLLGDADKAFVTGNELIDARTPQPINVKLHMSGSLTFPKLTFDLDVEDKHSQSTYAYQKLKQINVDERQKVNQVASLLLIGDFVPPDGISGSTVASGAINNVSQILSRTTSTALTNILNKLTGDKQLNIDVKYTNYNYSDQTLGGINRNQLTVGVNKSYFNDRLMVEVGSTSNWGKPTSANTSSFNLTGDFRIQYKLSSTSGLRLNAFRTSDYDVTLDRDIVRSGVGITWHKNFDNLTEFFRGNKYAQREKMKQETKMPEETADTPAKKIKGTE